ncbi:MAG: hypothetical protein ACQEXJ_09690 [Myxococcota bacterium]
MQNGAGTTWGRGLLAGALALLIVGCDDGDGTSGEADVVPDDVTTEDQVGAEDVPDAGPDDVEVDEDVAADVAPDVEDVDEGEPERVTGVDPPSMPAETLGFTPPERTPKGEPPTDAEVEAFTRKVMAFFAETHYFDWVYRMTHGLDASYDAEMMPYRLWWQGTRMRREGDTLVFTHHKYAENIAKRSVKVIDGAAAAYELTGDERMAEVAAGMMRGMVALSLGFESEREDPIVKYLQARAVFSHDHEYDVDGRHVRVDYGPTREASFKWNVAAFEIPDNPEYGSVWVANMRSKDDVPYMFHTVDVATRIYHRTDHPELKESARLYIEYMRGFAQRIVDDDWYILTRYEDGLATIAVDLTEEGTPPADLGSFVHWESVMGPDAECNAQLGAALAGYGYFADKGDCEGGMVGREFEDIAGAGNWFNHNIYNYFHIAAVSGAQLWGHTDHAEALMAGLVERFETLLFNPEVPNSDHKEYAADSAGWLLSAASRGYPLDAREARHIMEWYGRSADWYRQYEHWDPWATLPEGQNVDWRPPRDTMIPDGEGGEKESAHVRAVEMPYVFEYCHSKLKAPNGVRFIDCDIVSDPTEWHEVAE